MDSNWLQWQETFQEHILNSVRTCYLAKIEDYDYNTRKANVKIIGNFEKDIDEYEQIPILTDINVGLPVGGEFFISLPIKSGDYGRLVILSQDIDICKDDGENHNTDINHNFNYSNSIFIPDFQPFNKSLPNHDENNLVIGKFNGGITLTFTTDDELIVKQDSTTKAILNENGTWEFVGNTTITGNLNITGTTHSTGAISCESNVSDYIGSMQEIRTLYNSHTHTDTRGDSTITLTPSM